MHRRHRARLTPLAAAALAALVATLAACGAGGVVDYGTGVTGGGTGTTGGTGGQTTAPFLGRWWRLYTFTSGGAARTSETFWDFRSDGSAVRTLITTNVTDGVADAVVWVGRWRMIGGEVEITYTSPTTGVVRFRWTIERGLNGDVLYLDDVWFQRLP
jgi:hypothetical protein